MLAGETLLAHFCRLLKVLSRSSFESATPCLTVGSGAAAGAEPPEVFKLGEPGHVEYSSVTVVLGRRSPPLKRAEAGRRDVRRICSSHASGEAWTRRSDGGARASALGCLTHDRMARARM
jgi:hypothetical protein